MQKKVNCNPPVCFQSLDNNTEDLLSLSVPKLNLGKRISTKIQQGTRKREEEKCSCAKFEFDNNNKRRQNI